MEKYINVRQSDGNVSRFLRTNEIIHAAVIVFFGERTQQNRRFLSVSEIAIIGF